MCKFIADLDQRAHTNDNSDKERADDEMLLERLYKDINNGGFRRKRGADLDLFDSDDEEETIARRRAAKQREFAKMRRALLADEKIGKIGELQSLRCILGAVLTMIQRRILNNKLSCKQSKTGQEMMTSTSWVILSHALRKYVICQRTLLKEVLLLFKMQ